MTDQASATIAAAAAAITGEGTPEAVKFTQRDDRMSIWARNLAGPAICAMIIAIVVLLAWGPQMHIWTAVTEAIRAHYVGSIGVALALMLGVLVWRLDGSKLGHLEVKMGPGSLSMGDDK